MMRRSSSGLRLCSRLRLPIRLAMDQDDEVRLEEEARDHPDSIWFDLLNVVRR